MKIDPTKPLSHEDFCELFEQVPLNDEERANIKELYWGIYEVCLANEDVTPADAWLATRNTFISMETQIKERMEK
jgi:hypothetical protein